MFITQEIAASKLAIGVRKSLPDARLTVSWPPALVAVMGAGLKYVMPLGSGVLKDAMSGALVS
ncbi:MAG: hypothetical protein M3Y54_12805, partial [Bacteroidota bacterium]|nr:hypothetical protein [Bacteroidota bacterium]